MFRRRSLALAAVAALMLATPHCGGKSGPTGSAETCSTYSGTYSATFTGTACALPADTSVLVQQHECDVSVMLADGSALHGELDSVGIWSFAFYPSNIPCFGNAGGTATVSGTTISGSYSGSASRDGCCSPYTVRFSWTRQ